MARAGRWMCLAIDWPGFEILRVCKQRFPLERWDSRQRNVLTMHSFTGSRRHGFLTPTIMLLVGLSFITADVQIAVCFWGLTRSLWATKDSLRHSVFDPLAQEGWQVTTYLHTFRVDEETGAPVFWRTIAGCSQITSSSNLFRTLIVIPKPRIWSWSRKQATPGTTVSKASQTYDSLCTR